MISHIQPFILYEIVINSIATEPLEHNTGPVARRWKKKKIEARFVMGVWWTHVKS